MVLHSCFRIEEAACLCFTSWCMYMTQICHKDNCFYLPTTMSSLSDACRLMRCQMSIVKRVLLLLNIEVREDMRAAIITAIIRPRIPAGEKKE